MKGTLHKSTTGWIVKYQTEGPMTWYKGNPESLTFVPRELPLHPDDVKQITEDSLIFDNIEARIAAYPSVDFEIVESDNGAMSFTEAYQTQKYAKLITVEPQVSDDFLIGPHGAFEYQDHKVDWDAVFEELQTKLSLQLKDNIKEWFKLNYRPPQKRLQTFNNKQPYQPANKELCDCGKMATYCYMPSYSGGGNPFHCSDCVPRGCTCNFNYIGIHGMPEGEEGKDWKWIEEYDKKVWVELDEKGREYPCAEYMWDPEGFDKN